MRNRHRRWPVGAALAALITLAAPAVTSAHVAYFSDRGNDTLTPFDTESYALSAPIPIGARPDNFAITPDGKTAFVVTQSQGWPFATPGGVTAVNLSSGVATPVLLSGTGITDPSPNAIAITPDGSTALVSGNDGTNAGFVLPVDVATKTTGQAVTGFGYNAHDLAITPDGATAYVLKGNEDVVPITLASGAAGAAIPMGLGGSSADAIAIDPTGVTAYIVASNLLLATLDLATNTPGPQISLPNVPSYLAITPDGGNLFATVANGGNTLVDRIDLATQTLGSVINTTPYQPFALAITPDGTRAFVSTSGGVTVVIDVETGVVSTALQVSGDAIAITPDQPPVAAFSATGTELGQPTSFDASASADADSSIDSYVWDFGDGETRTTTSPVTTHSYAAAGSYQATLTLTDDDGCSLSRTFTGHMVSCNGSALATATRSLAVAAGAAPPPAEPVPADPPAADQTPPSTPTTSPSMPTLKATFVIRRGRRVVRVAVGPSRVPRVKVRLLLRGRKGRTVRFATRTLRTGRTTIVYYAGLSSGVRSLGTRAIALKTFGVSP